MTLSGDDIIEATLLKPTEEDCGSHPPGWWTQATRDPQGHIPPRTPRDLWTHRALKAYWHSAHRITEQTDALTTLPPPSPMPQPSCHSSQKVKKHWREIWGWPEPCWQVGLLILTQKNEQVPHWWREFWSLLNPKDECFSDIKGMACQQAAAFRVPATQQKKDGSWIAPPCMVVLGWKDFLPPKGLPRSLGLSTGVAWRNGGAGHGPSEVCHPIQNATRMLCGAVQELCRYIPPTWEGRSTRSWDAGCGEEGPHDSCTCRKGLVTETQGRRTNWCTHP